MQQNEASEKQEDERKIGQHKKLEHMLNEIKIQKDRSEKINELKA